MFGRVIDGMDVVDTIVSQPRGSQAGMDDVPKTPIVIESAKVK